MAQPLSKRDRRRTQLIERLNDITNNFSVKQDAYYREQLQAIQLDTNLIMNADSSKGTPLPDPGPEIDEILAKMRPMPPSLLTNQDIRSITGKLYSEYVREINDAVEEKDAELQMHMVRYS